MPYPRPPITEAVIELRFARAVSRDAIETTCRRMRKEYIFQEPEDETEFKIDAKTKKVDVKSEWVGLKLSSADRADVLIIRTKTFLCSRLAPYNGWEAFHARALEAWQELRKATGVVEITRIGVRYINRIDVPIENNQLIRVEDYLNVRPYTPAGLTEPMSAYTMQVARPLGVDECSLTLTSSTVASPLIGHFSFALDLDIYREANVPKRDDALWEIVARMREHKNRVFESCVTDLSRGLFAK